MSKQLCEIAGVSVVQTDSGKVIYLAGAMIDGDGANGQHGAPPAYNKSDTGSEALANGGMKRNRTAGAKHPVVFAESWGADIVIVSGGYPMVLANGVVPSKTAYRYPGKSVDDPAAYVDAETVPYVVVPPQVRSLARGIVLGCRALVTSTATGGSCEAVVADIGPRSKIGELSIAAARAIGIPHSPRTGGIDRRVIRYELFPGTPAVVNGEAFALISVKHWSDALDS
jgi:hypothetical protein